MTLEPESIRAAEDIALAERVLAKLEFSDRPVFSPAELLYLTIAWREQVERDRHPRPRRGLLFLAGVGVGLWAGVAGAAAMLLLA